MKEWSIKRLYRESFSFRWSARFFILATILTLMIFLYQEFTNRDTWVFNNQNSTFLKDNFIKSFSVFPLTSVLQILGSIYPISSFKIILFEAAFANLSTC